VLVEIVADDERVLPPGQEGNLRIRSDHGATEYLEDPGETQRAFRDGWFYPGDRGYLTTDNMLVISSRAGSAQP
jgi:acyl-CoA synthetase (AMP-forming)/AMP-acid ligase II